MEKEKSELEQLLNSLIEKGWKPFGKCGLNLRKLSGIRQGWLLLHEPSTRVAENYSLRDLVSKLSGLWQFCIANHLLKKYSDLGDDGEYIIGRWQDGKDCKTEDGEYIDDNRDSDIYHQDDSYQYRLIESALKDESELEDFLLNSIELD